jgi:hypothetical protein
LDSFGVHTVVSHDAEDDAKDLRRLVRKAVTRTEVKKFLRSGFKPVELFL